LVREAAAEADRSQHGEAEEQGAHLPADEEHALRRYVPGVPGLEERPVGPAQLELPAESTETLLRLRFVVEDLPDAPDVDARWGDRRQPRVVALVRVEGVHAVERKMSGR